MSRPGDDRDQHRGEHRGEHEDEHAALLAELAAALRPETVPPAPLADTAKALFTWRTVDAELAELSYDSLLDPEPAGTRSSGPPRILTFEAGSLTIEVEVDESRGARRLLGHLVPATAAELELRSAGEPVHGRADELGRFVLPLPPDRGLLRLRVRPAAGPVVESAAVRL